MQPNIPSPAPTTPTPARPAAPQAIGRLRTVAFSLLVDRALSA